MENERPGRWVRSLEEATKERGWRSERAKNDAGGEDWARRLRHVRPAWSNEYCAGTGNEDTTPVMAERRARVAAGAQVKAHKESKGAAG